MGLASENFLVVRQKSEFLRPFVSSVDELVASRLGFGAKEQPQKQALCTARIFCRQVVGLVVAQSKTADESKHLVGCDRSVDSTLGTSPRSFLHADNTAFE
jgi:hypothetical protein